MPGGGTATERPRQSLDLGPMPASAFTVTGVLWLCVERTLWGGASQREGTEAEAGLGAWETARRSSGWSWQAGAQSGKGPKCRVGGWRGSTLNRGNSDSYRRTLSSRRWKALSACPEHRNAHGSVQVGPFLGSTASQDPVARIETSGVLDSCKWFLEHFQF